MNVTSKTRIVAATAVSLLCSGTMVQAQDMKKYGTAAGWDIVVRGDMGPGCLIAKKLDNDMQVQMGIDETTGRRGYMALYTKLAANVGSGEKRSVIFDVDGQKFSGRQPVSSWRDLMELTCGSTIQTSSTILPR